MGDIILIVIVSVIPLFSVFVLLSNTYGRLQKLRRAIVAVKMEEPLERYHEAVRLLAEADGEVSREVDELHSCCQEAVSLCERFRRDPLDAAAVRELNEVEARMGSLLNKVLEGPGVAEGARERGGQIEAIRREMLAAAGRYNERVAIYNQGRSGGWSWLVAGLFGLREGVGWDLDGIA